MTQSGDVFIRCWCGAEGNYHDLCDLSGLEDRCHQTMMRKCFCGGSQCVCHHHGQIPCDGCEDCADDGFGDAKELLNDQD